MEESVKNVLVIETSPAGVDGRLGVPLILIQGFHPVDNRPPKVNYVVSLEPIEYPNPSRRYTAGCLYVVYDWKGDGPSESHWIAKVRSTHYFKRREFHYPDMLQDLSTFGFTELAERVLIVGGDRVDIGKSVVYTFNNRRQ